MQQYIKQALLDFQVTSKATPQTIQLWKNRYLKFIESLENQVVPKGTKYHKHHIVPKSWRPDLKKDKNDIIKLTIKQHIIAHHILSKTEDYQMKCAIRRMVNVKSNDELYKAFFVINLKRFAMNGVDKLNLSLLLISIRYKFFLADLLHQINLE